MRQNVKDLSSQIDTAIQLCKKVLEYGEKIKSLSPQQETGADTYAEELTRMTEDRGRTTRAAIQEISLVSERFNEIENDSATSVSEKVLLNEKIQALQDLSILFAKQDVAIRKSIEKNLHTLRQESVVFHHNVNVIKSYLKTPDKKTFYG